MNSGQRPNIDIDTSPQTKVVDVMLTEGIPVDETPRGEALIEQIRTTKAWSSIGPIDKVLYDLAQLTAIDQAVEAKQKYWASFAWINIGIAAVSGALAIVTFGITLIIAIPAIIGFIYVLIQYFSFASANVENRRHEIPTILLNQLRADVPPTAKVELSLELAKYNADKFLEKKDGSMFGALSTYQYEVPWMILKGVFMDGTKFRLRVTTNLKRKEKRKNKGTKVTETYREKVNLLGVVEPMRYGGLDRFVQNLDVDHTLVTAPKVSVNAERVTIQAATSSMRHTGGVNVSKYDPLRNATGKLIMQQFQLLYQGLEHCKTPSSTTQQGGA